MPELFRSFPERGRNGGDSAIGANWCETTYLALENDSEETSDEHRRQGRHHHRWRKRYRP